MHSLKLCKGERFARGRLREDSYDYSIDHDLDSAGLRNLGSCPADCNSIGAAPGHEPDNLNAFEHNRAADADYYESSGPKPADADCTVNTAERDDPEYGSASPRNTTTGNYSAVNGPGIDALPVRSQHRSERDNFDDTRFNGSSWQHSINNEPVHAKFVYAGFVYAKFVTAVLRNESSARALFSGPNAEHNNFPSVGPEASSIASRKCGLAGPHFLPWSIFQLRVAFRAGSTTPESERR